jgi:hypothetical protein
MQRGQHHVPRGYTSFLGRAAENQPHIYMCTAALFLLFVLEQVLHEKKLWFTFFQKFTNSISSCFLSSLKRRTITDPVFWYWIISKPSKTYLQYALLNSFDFQCLFPCQICFLELPIDAMKSEIF